ncbi:MAG: hypothetical protein DRP47_11340 [Candidatus Zixiibacteriota bacterium]|nr:MAG: hypothetical protein DRP47_11340 [candidate division Zixibacteria bacterium]
MAVYFMLPATSLYAQGEPWIIAVDGLAFRELGPEIGSLELELKRLPKEPDGYLGDALRNAPNIANMSPKVISYSWSRDPADSREEIEVLKSAILAYYQHAAQKNRPLVIVAHSWGTVLAYTALHQLVDQGSDVRIACFITLGSPLNPRVDAGSGALVWNFLKNKSIMEGLPLNIIFKNQQKPSNVTGEWVNLWAKGDLISNQVSAANENVQIDKDNVLWNSLYFVANFGLRDYVLGPSTFKWHGEYYKNPRWINGEIPEIIKRNIPKRAIVAPTDQKTELYGLLMLIVFFFYSIFKLIGSLF